MTQVRDDIIPEDLSAFVHDAAGALPSGTYELERVVRRRRAHRRRAVAGLSLVGVIVMAVVVAIPVVLRSTTATDQVGDRTGPAQRLYYYVSPGKGTTGELAVGDATIRVPGGIVEVDGQGKLVVRTYLDANAAVQSVVGLPDGGLVAADLRGDDGFLTVVAPDGAIRVSRSIGEWDGYVRFVGATADAAYLMRRDQLRLHDLASGKERSAGATGRVRELIAAGWSVDSVVGDRVVLVKVGAKQVQATVLGLSGGRETAAVAVCGAGSGIGKGKGPNLMLSPDGRHFACFTPTGQTTTRVTVTQVSTGRLVFSRDFGPEYVLGWYESLAWVDDDTVRLAALRLPAGKDRVYDLREVLELVTVDI